MKNTLLLIISFFGFTTCTLAQNWDAIRFSDEYYCGEGKGETVEIARQNAMSDLTGRIATKVSSSFSHLIDETNSNGDIEHQSKVVSYVETSSQASLKNLTPWIVSDKAPNCVVRYYVKRAEVQRMFDSRVEKAKNYMERAAHDLEKRKIDSALKHYYWAYSLIRSVQYPADVKDEDGKMLIVKIEGKIIDILDNVDVTFDGRDDKDNVTFLFTYDGEPVSSLLFSCNDGVGIQTGNKAKDGRGSVQVRSTHSGNVYHLNIEYEFKGEAQSDDELGLVLDVVPRKVFAAAEKKALGESAKKSKAQQAQEKEAAEIVNAHQLKPQEFQLAKEVQSHQATMDAVLKAITERRYSDVSNFTYFTYDGLDVFEKLVFYGTGRVVGVPNIQFFKGLDGCVVARGLQMSFTFTKGRKQTFVEDVIFYFNSEGKIDNMSFGLGVDATNDILNRSAGSWSNDAREILLQFLENYKTAYALERLDYINSIFSDQAHIIVGKVLKAKSNMYAERGQNISVEGQNIIQYNRYDKTGYMEHLKKVFANNEFINLNFSDVSLRKITKFSDKEKFVIQLAQDYTSSIYSDRGYLMLLVDITNKEEPLIEIRTWQPNEVDINEVFHEGRFYSN